MNLLEKLDNAKFLESQKESINGITYNCFGDESCFCDDGIKAKYSVENFSYDKMEKMNKVYEIE